ncbi:isoprenylcysteine carboxylmethyltransferase family protein [Parvularcula sp. LCG005]|uniref:methyltransferase family protein n=1 Tax=Parvularcula sp. LCG005 TaxID=3078805 RepID=UPI002942212A|nr:isoprenylcysteine carboxylmethyltransferase family protein [Parvularcula sp. LCG005]WOI53915.1 isoprenylcysteine carboxylmethyltransferase family protein [Parvularcula sp. LCG005]
MDDSAGNRMAGPSRLPWPPMLVVVALLIGFGMQRLSPLPPPPVPVYVGGLLVALGIGIDLWVFWLFRQRKTNIMPTKPAEALVTTGPFSWSRNPIYLANVLIIVGFIFVGQSWWFLIGASLFVVLVTELQIKKEEAHLAEKFGMEWQAYAAKTRRWI